MTARCMNDMPDNCDRAKNIVLLVVPVIFPDLPSDIVFRFLKMRKHGLLVPRGWSFNLVTKREIAKKRPLYRPRQLANLDEA